MKLPEHYSPGLCTADSSYERPQLEDPYYDAEARSVVATDGHMMVVLPVEGAKASDKSRYLRRPKKRTFPAWRHVLPEFKDGDEGVVSVALNASYLNRIAQAMNAENDQVVLTFRPADEDKIVVLVRKDGGEPGEFGLLMPCRIFRKLQPVTIERPKEPKKKAAP